MGGVRGSDTPIEPPRSAPIRADPVTLEAQGELGKMRPLCYEQNDQRISQLQKAILLLFNKIKIQNYVSHYTKLK